MSLQRDGICVYFLIHAINNIRSSWLVHLKGIFLAIAELHQNQYKSQQRARWTFA